MLETNVILRLNCQIFNKIRLDMIFLRQNKNIIGYVRRINCQNINTNVFLFITSQIVILFPNHQTFSSSEFRLDFICQNIKIIS